MPSLKRADRPFTHAVTEGAFDAALADRLRDEVRTFDSWESSEQRHYRHSVAYFTSDAVPASLTQVVSHSMTRQVQEAMESVFEVRLLPRADMMLSRFDAGDGTLIHNDYVDDVKHQHFFTHRALLYLNESWDPSMGGVLGLFESPQDARPTTLVEPRHNSMVAMAMSPRSYHAVSAQRGHSPRFSIVWSFCTVDRKHQL